MRHHDEKGESVSDLIFEVVMKKRKNAKENLVKFGYCEREMTFEESEVAILEFERLVHGVVERRDRNKKKGI